MSRLVTEVLRQAPSLDELVKLLAELSGRAQDDVRHELAEHLGARVAFLLLGDVMDAPNYTTLEARLAKRSLKSATNLAPLAGHLAQAAALVEAASITKKVSLRDLPYPIRQRLVGLQNNRCGICGWAFGDDVPPWRSQDECAATLDHRVPFRLGGERVENLWILCALCNSIKESRVHVGEHGRVWLNNHVYYLGERPVAFWTLSRERRCCVCGAGPEATRLRVRRRNGSGAWVLDNCETICIGHAELGGAIDY